MEGSVDTPTTISESSVPENRLTSVKTNASLSNLSFSQKQTLIKTMFDSRGGDHNVFLSQKDARKLKHDKTKEFLELDPTKLSIEPRETISMYELDPLYQSESKHSEQERDRVYATPADSFGTNSKSKVNPMHSFHSKASSSKQHGINKIADSRSIRPLGTYYRLPFFSFRFCYVVFYSTSRRWERTIP
jgi:hypothetical protein